MYFISNFKNYLYSNKLQFILLLCSLVSFQTIVANTTNNTAVEKFIEDVITDSQFGFHNVIEKYGNTADAPFERIEELEDFAVYDDSKKAYYISFTISKEQESIYLDVMGSMLSEWQKTDKLGLGPYPYIQYSKDFKEVGDIKTVRLSQNLKDNNATFSVEHTCHSCKNPIASQSILRNRVFHKEGKNDFKNLLQQAEMGFADIIVPGSKQGTHYVVKPSYLNPENGIKGELTISEKDGQRILQLKPTEEFGGPEFAFELLEHWDYDYKKFLPKDEWTHDNNEAYYSATKKTANGQYVRVRRRINAETNNDYLEIVSSNTQPIDTETLIANAEQKELEAMQVKLKKYLGCQSGDCENGFGNYNFVDSTGLIPSVKTYEGEFANGKFDGLGRIFYFSSTDQLINGFAPKITKDRIPSVVGRFLNGELDKSKSHFFPQILTADKFELIKKVYKGNAINYTNFELFTKNDNLEVFVLPIASEINGRTKTKHEYIIYDKLPSGKKLQITAPFTTDYGTCISGTCGTDAQNSSQTSPGTLKIDGLGLFKGEFHKDGSASRGILTLESGDGIGIFLSRGIPVRLENVIVPKNSTRFEKAKEGKWLMTLRNMCLQGDCSTNGQGVSSYIYDCEGNPKRKTTVGYYTGKHVDWLVPESGTGTYNTYYLPYEYKKPTFFCHRLDGLIHLQVTDSDVSEDILFKNDIKYTKDGTEPYEDFLARERSAERKAWLASLEKERLRQKAVNDEKRAEQQKRIKAQQQKLRKQSTTPINPNPCRFCNGTGKQWQETGAVNCTVTYDFTFSSGVYYQTYEHCTDNRSGYEINCDICNGSGRRQ